MAPRFNSIVLVVDPLQGPGSAEAVAAALGRAADVPVVTHTATDVVEDPVARGDGVLFVIMATTWASSGPIRLDDGSEAVLAQASQPVVVVGPSHGRSPLRRPTPIAVVDGTGIADAAMPVLEALVHTFPGAAARLVEVLPPTTLPLPATDAERHVRRYADLLAGHAIAVRGDVLRGYEPAPTLLAYTRDIHDALLVVTSPRSAGDPTHWFNTVRRLIRSATQPVLVVPADRPGYGS